MQMENTPKMSLYEKTREDRIKENLARMQQLGLKDLAVKLNSCDANRTKRACRRKPTSVTLSSHISEYGPARRSSRLQNATPVIYSEVLLKEKYGSRSNNSTSPRHNKSKRLQVGARPEVYTEEHAKLLGNTERSWTLYVDGIGKDGKRIYDPINGKTCHQCRQKTLGYRTHCSQCQIVQGQFCGDCLYTRYGEHVLEAIEDPNWICPPCRGICNCSLCRNAKGWLPTGYLYRKVSSLGYKSVAHYLIQTLQSKNLEKSLVPADDLSAKRSLSFPTSLSEESTLVSHEQIGYLNPQGEDKIDDDSKTEQYSEAESEIVEPTCKGSALVVWEQVGNKINNESNGGKEQQMTDHLIPLTDYQTKGSLPLSSKEGHSENRESEEDNHCSPRIYFKDETDKVIEGDSSVAPATPTPYPTSIAARLRSRHKKVESCNAGLNEKKSLSNASASQELENVKKRRIEDVTHMDSSAALENSQKLNKKGNAAEASQDSIGARLRQRRRIGTNDHDDVKLVGMGEENSVYNLLSDHDDVKLVGMGEENSVYNLLSDQEENKAKETQAKDVKHTITPKREKKAVAAEPNPDSIGGRLRQRRQTGTTLDK